jgi:membrane protein
MPSEAVAPAPSAVVRPKTRAGRALQRLWQLIEQGVGDFFRDGCPQRAASISFYALFSIFPLAILSVAVLGLVLNDDAARTRVISFLLDNLPLTEDGGRRQLQRLLEQVTRDVAGFSVLGIGTLLFAASGIMAAIRHALNAAFNTADDRPPVQAKLWDFAMVLVFGALVTASLALTLADQIRSRISRSADELIPGAGGVITEVLISAGRIVPLALAVIVFAGLFRLVPSTRPRLRDIWPGVLVAAVGYELAKTGFGIYLTSFANYGAVYASLGSIIAFLVFVFIAANVALLGAEFASQWPRVRSGEYDGPPGPPAHVQVWGFVKGLFVRQRSD